MADALMNLLLGIGAVGVFLTSYTTAVYLLKRPKRRLLLSDSFWRFWTKAVGKEEEEEWDHLLRKAGRPFGWGKAEWTFLQWLFGGSLLFIIVLWTLFRGNGTFPYLTFCIVPSLGYWLPHLLLKGWAGYREELLSTDIARFTNRYLNLLENQVPPYTALVKAARPTRLLKQYIPSLSEWNKDRFAALEAFKRQLGVDDGIMLVSNLRTIEQLSAHQMSLTMQRLEWAVDNRREFRHRKKIKSLGIGYSVIVYPAFYIGLIVAMFPWYKLLTELLSKYLL
ncbi:hypothetical protein G3578_14780 [Brevibacillus sp. SYP-B805]|nr:hypothetical protein [Brevibacillus sp. SYP-B805]NGQ96426.1 hypothetical protein [Brevibacillus sp. SYP-B805]